MNIYLVSINSNNDDTVSNSTSNTLFCGLARQSYDFEFFYDLLFFSPIHDYFPVQTKMQCSAFISD